LIRSATRSIDTTNFIGLSKWWEQPWGERYETANKQAAANGVKISRTFIFKTDNDIGLAENITTRAVTKGIIVRYALLKDLLPLTGDVVSIDCGGRAPTSRLDMDSVRRSSL
jgi:hypothetical protein